MVDDHGSGVPGRRPDGAQADDDSARVADQEYTFGSKPGEDFGPILPPAPAATEREPSRPPHDDLTTGVGATARLDARGSSGATEPYRPKGVRSPTAGRERWRPIVVVIGALLVLGGLTAVLLLVISRQAIEAGSGMEAPAQVSASTSVPPVASPAAAPSPAVLRPTSAAPAASPTPLALAPPTPSPTPAVTRSPVARPTVRPAPALVPALPAIVTPPAPRSATSAPARLVTPTRTPLPVGTARPARLSTRVWSDRAMHRVGDTASICAQATSGSSAQIVVLGPDRTSQTLGELSPPVERVCYALEVDATGLYVLTLIVKDARGVEIERQSAALWVSR
jgi:hypothetical protein